MRIALGIEYCGTNFRGWQSQAGGGTVQDALEAALAQIAGERIGVLCAGRTDAGVHATHQVAHFDTTVERPLSAWVRGVNSQLPEGVAVRWAQPVSDEFNARFSAHSRSYRYLLFNSPVRPAIGATLAGWFHRPLATEPMAEAARALCGEHDFSAFRSSECQAKSPVRTLHRLDVRRQGDWIAFDLGANAFLHHMVRNIVGALVDIGCGRRPPAWTGDLLAQRDRRLAAPTFSPCGLYLVGVGYDAHWGLPQAALHRLPPIGPMLD